MALTDKLTAIADAIRAKTGKSDSLTLDQMPTEIANITGGGGSSADERVKYVTFMYGASELIKYPVISGDTCRDPVTLGLINKPTKESTPQYTYEHNGWSMTDGGSASASALTNVTEDRTVYAAFRADLRKYTITYLDEDGSTLHSETLNYDDMPGYAPQKDGYFVSGWTPAFAKVTGDASYTVIWQEGYIFSQVSWDKLAEISAAGDAKKYFKAGDIRTDYVEGRGDVRFMLMGFDHDDNGYSEGKVGMTIAMVDNGKTTATGYESNSWITTLVGSSNLKYIKKPQSSDPSKIWSFSIKELNATPVSSLAEETEYVNRGTDAYEAVTNGAYAAAQYSTNTGTGFFLDGVPTTGYRAWAYCNNGKTFEANWGANTNKRYSRYLFGI